MCICSDTCGDVGTLSLEGLLEEKVSRGRPNFLLEKDNVVSAAKQTRQDIRIQ